MLLPHTDVTRALAVAERIQRGIRGLSVKARAARSKTVTIAGRYCESTDILVRDCALPRLQPGDLLAVPAAGAYTLSMASNYNVSMRPAVVFAADGRARLVRRRETVDDLLRCEVVGSS